jgi:hypothetical protein
MRDLFVVKPTLDSIEKYRLRTANCFNDLDFVRTGKVYLALDAFVVIEGYLGAEESEYRGLVRNILQSKVFPLIIFPETLVELNDRIERGASEIRSIDPLYLRNRYLKNKKVRKFMVLMQRRPRPWDDIMSVIVSLLSSDATRVDTRRLFEYVFAEEYRIPLNELRKFLRTGVLRHFMSIKNEFGVTTLDPDKDLLRIYFESLNRIRNKDRNDYVDASVAARAFRLNDAARNCGALKACRFFSHESMLDYLEGSGSNNEPGTRVVRSLVDLTLLMKLQHGDRNLAEGLRIWLEATNEFLASPQLGWTEEREWLTLLSSQLNELFRDAGLSPSNEWSPGVGHHVLRTAGDLIRARLDRFFRLVQRIEEGEARPAEEYENIRKKVNKLYGLLCMLDSGNRESFEEYERRISGDVWKLRLTDFEKIEADTDILVGSLRLVDADQDPFEFINYVLTSRIDLDYVLRRVRREVLQDKELSEETLSVAAALYHEIQQHHRRHASEWERRFSARLEEILMIATEDPEEANMLVEDLLQDSDEDRQLRDRVLLECKILIESISEAGDESDTAIRNLRILEAKLRLGR